jgi:hypothetical protein
MLKNQILEMFPIGEVAFVDPGAPGGFLPSRRLGDPITAIASGVGAIGSIAGGIIGGNAAKDAANTQTAAAQQAGQQVVDTTAAANPQIGTAATNAGQAVTGTASTAAANTLGAGTAANALLDPYASMGGGAANALAANTAAGAYNSTPTMADLQIDPGFAFRLAQGQKALANSAAAKGGAVSGAALKSLDQFTQADASQEYAAAFQRYQTNKQNNFSDLSTMSGMGQQAAGAQGQNLVNTNEWGGALNTGATEFAGQANMNAANAMSQNTINAAKAQGEYLTQGANAQAAGDVGQANAITSGISGVGSSMMNGLIMNSVLGKGASSSSAPTGNVQVPMIGGQPWGGGGYSPGDYSTGTGV